MTNSDKILLKTLLIIESELSKTQSLLEKNNSFFTIQFNFTHFYDLFEVIISAFNIPETNFDTLYDLLNQLFSNKISIETSINLIDSLISST